VEAFYRILIGFRQQTTRIIIALIAIPGGVLRMVIGCLAEKGQTYPYLL